MSDRRSLRIPDFVDGPAPAAYSPTGLAARAIFLRNVASAWQKAGDDSTAEKMRRDAERQARRFRQSEPG